MLAGGKSRTRGGYGVLICTIEDKLSPLSWVREIFHFFATTSDTIVAHPFFETSSTRSICALETISLFDLLF